MNRLIYKNKTLKNVIIFMKMNKYSKLKKFNFDLKLKKLNSHYLYDTYYNLNNFRSNNYF